MKKFEFRLERVERWRVLQMKLQEEKTQQALDRLQTAKMQVAALTEQMADAGDAIRQGGDAVALAAYPAYVGRLARDAKALGIAVQKLEAAAGLERKRLLEMHRGVRLLELLHESRLKAWTAESDREAELFAGEAFLSRVQSNIRARSSSG